MDLNIAKTHKKRIVIIGGGFGGLNLAKSLDKNIFQVILVDKYNYHQFQPLLYQIASSGLESGSICFPHRELFQRKRVYFRMAEAFSIDSSEKKVETSCGDITYDYLVLAAGTTTHFFNNEEIEKEALPMKNIEEALFLKNQVLQNLEKAVICTDETEKKALMNIVIVGGGASGVEIAGALSEMKRYVLKKDYPELNMEELNLYIIDSSSRLLKSFSEKASAAAKKFLKNMGVQILLNTRVTGYSEGMVTLSHGEAIASKNIIWVSGVKANRFKNIPTEQLGNGGRIIVDSFNRVQGMEDVYAIGDICLQTEKAYPNGHPQVAPVAIQQGILLAKNLSFLELGKDLKPFRYKNRGSLATIGRNKAVADFRFFHLSGFFAWALWMLVHIRSILGAKNKLIVLIDWIWNYFSYNQSFRIILPLKTQEKTVEEPETK